MTKKNTPIPRNFEGINCQDHGSVLLTFKYMSEYFLKERGFQKDHKITTIVGNEQDALLHHCRL